MSRGGGEAVDGLYHNYTLVMRPSWGMMSITNISEEYSKTR
jgi:hypothetical protein